MCTKQKQNKQKKNHINYEKSQKGQKRITNSVAIIVTSKKVLQIHCIVTWCVASLCTYFALKLLIEQHRIDTCVSDQVSIVVNCCKTQVNATKTVFGGADNNMYFQVYKYYN